MRTARSLERIATLATAAALALSSTAVALALWPQSTTGTPGADEIARTRQRLERAAAIRYEMADEASDTHFDALVGSLEAGLGTDTPRELEHALARLETARQTERAMTVARPSADPTHARAVATLPEVDLALAECSRTLDRVGAARPTASARPLGWVWAAACAGLVAAVAGALARGLRRRERDQIAEIVECPVGGAHDGRLAAQVGRHVVAAWSEGAQSGFERATRRPLPSELPLVSARREPRDEPAPVAVHALDPAAWIETDDGDAECDSGEHAITEDVPMPALGLKILEIKAEHLSEPLPD